MKESKRFITNSKQPYFDYLAKNHRFNLSQRTADSLTKFVGSWTFLLLLAFLIAFWIFINSYLLLNLDKKSFDPYPYILFNLVLACITALQVPIILMSQNRAEERDRGRAEYDYAINRKAEKEIRLIQEDLRKIKAVLKVK